MLDVFGVWVSGLEHGWMDLWNVCDRLYLM